jgi:hypothetical protein
MFPLHFSPRVGERLLVGSGALVHPGNRGLVMVTRLFLFGDYAGNRGMRGVGGEGVGVLPLRLYR